MVIEDASYLSKDSLNLLNSCSSLLKYKFVKTKQKISCEVITLKKFCDENDFEYSVDHSMSPGVDGNSFPIKNLLPKAKDLIMESLRPSSPLYVGTIDKPKNYDPKNHIGEPVCGAGRHTMNITSEGNISPCNSLPLTYGNIKNDNIDEVILATSATVEGQTTAFYIQDSLKNTNVKISKLAQGLPVGGEIETSDDGTLISAFKNRRDL
mgnify:CR=1 FL=1